MPTSRRVRSAGLRTALALLAVFAGSAIAEPESVAPRPVPLPIFGPSVNAVARIRLAGLTSARVEAAIRAVFPEGKGPSHDDVEKSVRSLEATLLGPLRAANVESFDFVVIGGGSSALMVPLDAGAAPEQALALEEAAKRLEMTATRRKGWMALHKGPLPAAEDVPISDAAFEEAFSRLPAGDLVVAFVPSAEQRAGAEAKYDQSIASASDDSERRSLLRGTRAIVQADWYGATVDLGPTPSIVAMARLRDAEAATSLEAGMARMAERQRADIRAKATSDDDPAHRYDPAPLLRMVDAVAVRAERDTAVIRIDAAGLRDVVVGILYSLERAGESIIDAFASALVGGRSKQKPAKQPDDMAR